MRISPLNVTIYMSPPPHIHTLEKNYTKIRYQIRIAIRRAQNAKR